MFTCTATWQFLRKAVAGEPPPARATKLEYVTRNPVLSGSMVTLAVPAGQPDPLMDRTSSVTCPDGGTALSTFVAARAAPAVDTARVAASATRATLPTLANLSLM